MGINSVIHINYGSYTDHIQCQNGDALLTELRSVLNDMGPGVVSVSMGEPSDIHLRYEVHKMFVGEFGVNPAPERLWRISAERDKDFLRKLEDISNYEKISAHPEAITIPLEECECTAGIQPHFEKHLNDEELLALVNASYQTLPEEYRTIQHSPQMN